MNANLNCQGYLASWQAWAAHSATTLAGRAESLAGLLYLVIEAGGRLLVCGNGGSAADGQHFAAELVGRFAYERDAMPAMALACQPSAVTALANDYGFESVFARQVDAFGRPGDCLIGISTSGSSPNVLAAFRTAKRNGLLTVAFTGADGVESGAAACVDVEVCVPRPPGPGDGLTTPHVQEVHIALLHAIAAGIERAALRMRPVECRTRHSPTPARERLTPRRPAVFLDRDGTLIAKRDLVKDPAQVELLPGAAEAVGRLNACRVPAVLVTNQAAIGRGQLSEVALMLVNDRLEQLLAAAGARLDAVYFCPHVPGNCGCRKPLPGMLFQAAAELRLDLGGSWTVGDTWGDVQAGLASGGTGVLVRTGLGAQQEEEHARVRQAFPDGRGDGRVGGTPAASLPPEVEGRYFVAGTVRDAVDMALEAMGCVGPAVAGEGG